MPRKHLTEQYQCNVSPAQDEAIRAIDPHIEKSTLVRQLLEAYVEQAPGENTWPKSPGRGQHKRHKEKN